MEAMVFFVFWWLLLAVLVGVFANQRRRRSGFGWFLMAILIGPLFAFLFVLILRSKEVDMLPQLSRELGVD
jgi:hypothetical protein